MESVNRNLQVVLFSNSWIAIGAGLTTFYFSSKMVGSAVSFHFLYALFVAFLTFTAYNFQRLVKHNNKDTPSSIRHFWIKNNSNKVLLFSLFGCVASCLLAYSLLNATVILYSLPIGLMVLFYAQVIPHFKGIRSIPIIKNVITSWVWCYAIIVVPLMLSESNISFFEMLFNHQLNLWALFVFIFGVSIPFDIRDVHQDNGKITTLVGIVGVKNSKIVLIFCFSFSFIMGLTTGLWVFAGCSLLGVLLTILTHPERSELFYSFFWDGLLVCFGIGLLIEKVTIFFLNY